MAKKKPENTPPPQKDGTPQLKNQYALNSHLLKNIERMPFSEEHGHSPNKPRSFVTRELRNILSAQAGVELFPEQTEKQEDEPLSAKFTKKRKQAEPQPEQLFELDDYTRSQSGYSLPPPQQDYFQRQYQDSKPPTVQHEEVYEDPDHTQSDYHKQILQQTQQRLPQQKVPPPAPDAASAWGAPATPTTHSSQRYTPVPGLNFPPPGSNTNPEAPVPPQASPENDSDSAWGAPPGSGFSAPQFPQAGTPPGPTFGPPPQERADQGQRYSEEQALASQQRHLQYVEEQQKIQQAELKERKQQSSKEQSSEQAKARAPQLDAEAEKLAEENAFLHKVFRKIQMDLAEQGLIEMPAQRASIPWHQYPNAAENPTQPGQPRQGEARPGIGAQSVQNSADPRRTQKSAAPYANPWDAPSEEAPHMGSGLPDGSQQGSPAAGSYQGSPAAGFFQGPPAAQEFPQSQPPASQPSESPQSRPPTAQESPQSQPPAAQESPQSRTQASPPPPGSPQVAPQPPAYKDPTFEPTPQPRRRRRKTRPVDTDAFGLSKSERGTIEVIWRPDGRSITPIYNMVGILKGIEFSDGSKYLRKDNDEWVVLDPSGQEVEEQKIARLVIDKGGNVTIFAPTGEKTTLLVSGETIVASVQGATPGQDPGS